MIPYTVDVQSKDPSLLALLVVAIAWTLYFPGAVEVPAALPSSLRSRSFSWLPHPCERRFTERDRDPVPVQEAGDPGMLSCDWRSGVILPLTDVTCRVELLKVRAPVPRREGGCGRKLTCHFGKVKASLAVSAAQRWNVHLRAFLQLLRDPVPTAFTLPGLWRHTCRSWPSTSRRQVQGRCSSSQGQS